MREITLEEQKEILVQMLEFIDNTCRANNVEYSLAYGSLIGAIRHNGIIPWDDDVDIILLSDQYEKLINCLKESKNQQYRLLNIETEPTYYYPFAKLVDMRTTGYEIGCRKINNYGIYIDIFKYNNIPNDERKIRKYYKKSQFLKKLLGYSYVDKVEGYIKNNIRKLISNIDSKTLVRIYNKHCEKYNNNDEKYLFSNWCVYGMKKELQLKNNFKCFEDIQFGGITARISSDYDNILKNIYGDYMTLPPINERITHHNTKMYWKD